jgi:hypothetical protein
MRARGRMLFLIAAAIGIVLALGVSLRRGPAPVLGAQAAAPADAAKSKPEPADNSYCYVCHGNYEDEKLAAIHRDQGIGCVKCHGESVKHSGDEDNITPPEIMYPSSKIDAACAKCHDSHDAPAAKVIARWQQSCPGKTNAKDVTCTDCHGSHRLKVRTRRWDKATGKLISDDGVRMMEKPPAGKK